MDRVELFNEVVKAASPVGVEKSRAVSLDDDLIALGLDSLDTLLVSIYYCDIYGIPEEKAKELRPTVIDFGEGKSTRRMLLSSVYEFVDAHKTREPATLEEALKRIR